MSTHPLWECDLDYECIYYFTNYLEWDKEKLDYGIDLFLWLNWEGGMFVCSDVSCFEILIQIAHK